MENENPSKENLHKLLVLFPDMTSRLTAETRSGNGSDGSNGQTAAFLLSFLDDLVRCVKSSLLSINGLANQAVEKFDTPEIRQHFQTGIAQDIRKIDSVLNTLLNYMNVTTPLIKTNTLSIILEEILEANEKQLRDKRIHAFKNCDADLPQTYMHAEQVRFVLNSLLQYAIHYTPPDGNIGFSIKLVKPSSPVTSQETFAKNNKPHVGVSIGFSGSKSKGEPPGNGSGGNGSGTKEIPKDQAIELILKLVREMIERNYGTLKFVADEKGTKTLITIRLSLERRKAIHYEPINM
jgi:signal transduction histidine kinase